MPELRFNPLLGTYTMVATNRQQRPHLPEDNCPFCPGSGKVPDDYEVLVYNNDFPTLSEQPEAVASGSSFYHVEPAYGKCEVILYTADHNSSLSQLSVEQIKKVVDVWAQRTAALSKDEKIKYIFPFENKGVEVGVTMHHPHGQLYAYPFIPLKLKTELCNCRKYFIDTGSCFFTDMNLAEKQEAKRMVFENESFAVYIPYFTDYPFGVFIVTKTGKSNLAEMDEKENAELAEALKKVTAAFDKLFNKSFPYMMCVHQAPVNSPEYGNVSDYFHFHIEFYPPLREENKIKWYASSEMGAWAAANTLSVEECAGRLRELITSSP